MEPMKRALRDALGNRAARQPDALQLRARDEPVLPPGDAGQLRIEGGVRHVSLLLVRFCASPLIVDKEALRVRR
jgi:hypothetical protein